MASSPPSLAPAPDKFATFGALLRFLRRRAGLTQAELGIAVGYSDAQISRLEQNQRLPDPAMISARFVPALGLEHEPELVGRLSELACSARSLPRHNLPTQLTSFIGREREMAEVKRFLTPRSPSPGPQFGQERGQGVRLLTLTGPGGCGKTRLSLQIAAELVAEYSDGVWLIDLAPISDPTLVPQALAATLGVREELGRPFLTTLATQLREREVLLLFDNCEHLVETCARWVEALLHACPTLRILATSREVLGVAGETVWRVPPLSLPDPRRLPPLEGLTQYEALRLFVDRAVTALPGFALTPQNALAVAQVCHRLDGMPLAIELAAARVGVLRVEQVAARLGDRFGLLTGGSRTALPRHQTLQAAIEWSYELLSEAERALLRRLAVFVGGWTLEAGEAVVGWLGGSVARVASTWEAEPPNHLTTQPPFAVLDLLQALVNKSLVVMQREPGREPRYRLLETIREYALARLVENGEAEATQRRHADFFLSLAETVKPSDDTVPAWLQQFVAEHDNLRAAMDWAFESAPDLGLQLAEALGPLWNCSQGDALLNWQRLTLAEVLGPLWNCGYLSEGRAHLMRALALTEAQGSTRTRARLLHAAGALAWQQGDYAAARSWFEQSVTVSRENGDKQQLALSLVFLGRMMAVLHGPHAAARSLQEEAAAICRETGDRFLLAKTLQYLGATVAAQGDEATARSIQEASAALYQELGDKLNLATPLGYLGYLALRQRDYAAARSLFEESLALARRWHRWGIAWRLEGFAGLAALEGEPERAARLYGAAEALLDSIGARLDPLDRLGYDHYVATAREQLGGAAFARAWAEGREMTVEEAIEYAMEAAQPADLSGLYRNGFRAGRPEET